MTGGRAESTAEEQQCPYCTGTCDEQHRWRVADVFSGPGGVGHSLNQIGNDDRILIDLAGIDRDDHASTYPGGFHQFDVNNVQQLVDRFIGHDIDLLWMSPPCQAYSQLSYAHHDNPKDVHPTFRDLGVRAIIHYLDPEEYIIENVKGCDDLRNPTRINGHGVGEEYGLERRFETSFDCPDALASGESVLDMSSGIGRSYAQVAKAKGIPKEWGKREVRSAIPEAYIRYLLYHCPSTPGVTPPVDAPGGVQASLAEVTP